MEKEEFKRSIKNVVWAIRRIVSLIYYNSRSMVKKYGVTGPQSMLIKLLYASDEALSSAELARRMNVTPSNITGIIDRLEEKEIVVRIRKPDDRRISLIELTEKGKDFGEKLPDLIEEKLMDGLSNLSSTEVYGIYMAIDQIVNIIGEEKIDDIAIEEY